MTRSRYGSWSCLFRQVRIDPLGKGTVSLFREMDAIECQWDIPLPGIHECDAQLLGQGLIRFCQFHRFRNQAFLCDPLAPFMGGGAISRISLHLGWMYRRNASMREQVSTAE